jgi:hypothetical protein
MSGPTNAYTKLVTSLNEAVAKGKILDVSAIQADGTGTRKINVPKTAKGTKKWVGDFPVVSDNYNSYSFAMQLLGDEYLPLAQEYLQLYGGQKITKTPKATVARTTGHLGPIIPTFPVYAHTPAPVAAPPGTVFTPVRTPKVLTPRTPKAPRSPTIRQPAILTVPTTTIPIAQTGLYQGGTVVPRIPVAQTGLYQGGTIVPTIPIAQTGLYQGGYKPASPRATTPPRVPTVPLVAPIGITGIPTVRAPSPRGTALPTIPGIRPSSPRGTIVPTIPIARPISPRNTVVPTIPIVGPPSPRNTTLPVINRIATPPRAASPTRTGSPLLGSPFQ